MKVLGVVGSFRKNGNTDILVNKVLEGVKSCGIGTECIYLSDFNFKDCIGCEGCAKTNKCVIKDEMQDIYRLLEESDGIVLGSPTYFYNVTGDIKKFLDRLYCYNVFDHSDRSVWVSVNEALKMKYGVTVAICEQNNENDMGYTSITMDRTLQAVGYRVVDSLKVLHMFLKGEVKDYENEMKRGYASGVKLGKTLILSEKVRKNSNI
ncbi:MAG: flavodoxin family protein [Fusobacterium sp. JB021]|nr:flavodoxin family protein [Fusobacterium sp. JB020]MDP0494464.1 flavodoxin family protein [Fusobacterium sp. JB021]MDP0506817.1 flavodoxin family protein [Fusobacterium sp. JB019]